MKLIFQLLNAACAVASFIIFTQGDIHSATYVLICAVGFNQYAEGCEKK